MDFKIDQDALEKFENKLKKIERKGKTQGNGNSSS